MAKYDTSIGDLAQRVVSAKKIVILLPQTSNVDKIAAALSLMLGLQKSGKDVEVVTGESLKVSHGSLFGVGQVKNSFPAAGGDNFVLTLEGVVDSNGLVSSLEKLDWYPEGANLNLVFHTASGKKFEPTNIKPSTSAGKIDLVFVIGAKDLSDLGLIHTQNPQIKELPQVNIDNAEGNSNFGQINIVDPTSPSLSEIVMNLFTTLGVTVDLDIASNIMVGIYDATANLTQEVTPETFTILAQVAQAGGKLPQTPVVSQPSDASNATQGFDLRELMKTPVETETPPLPSAASQPADAAYITQQESFTNPPVTSASFDETPSGEFATSRSPEGTEYSTSYTPSANQPNTESDTVNPAPDWLTPKIYKGGGLG